MPAKAKTNPNREEQVHLRVTTAEMNLFRELAESRGQTVAVLVRDLVRKEHAKTFGASLKRKAGAR